MKSHVLSLSVLLLMIFLPAVVSAQDTASITGTVTDPTGAAIANAEVTVTSLERGINRTTATNQSGDYLVAGLPSGAVNLSITAPGFKKYEAKSVILRVGQKARNDVALQVGAASAEVTVEGTNVAQVETQSSDLSGTVTGKQITQLELNGRNFTQLITLVPGVSNQSGQDDAGVGVAGNVSFSINGGRTEYNNWELDGGDNMDNGSNTTLNVYPSLEAIAEFKVLTSNYGAQYGRNGSGTIEVETKSGTNQFHGNAYEFVRNDIFNAQTFPQDTVPAYKKNDFGYTIGGPVYIPGVYNQGKDKTFFFWSQEWRRERIPANLGSVTVPSVLERGGDFSDICPASGAEFARAPDPSLPPDFPIFPDCPASGPGVIVPGLSFIGFPSNLVPVDTVNSPALVAQIPAPTSGAFTWNASPTLPTSWREELFRIDHNINSKHRLTFRYIHDSWAQIYPTPLWTSGTSFPTIQTDFKGPGVSIVSRLTSTFSPTLLNEFVASYTTDHISLAPVGAWQRPAGMTFGLYPGADQGKVPGISLGGGGIYDFQEDVGYLPPNGPFNSNPTYTYRDNVTKIVGKHNLQFGFYFVAAQKNELGGPDPATNGSLSFDTSNSDVSTGNAFADLLIGRVSSFAQTSAQPKFYYRYKIFEPFIQDDWHVSSRLTLNLGMRFSLFGTYYERYHNSYNFDPSRYVLGNSSVDPDTGLVIGDPFNGIVQCGVTAGVSRSCMNGDLFNPAPRIGFAYDLTGDGKTAIRGGYGVFFEHTNGIEGNAESLESNVSPTVQSTSVFNLMSYAEIVPQPPGATSPFSVLSIPNQATWPYVQQWHLDVQHEFLRNTVATISYVGSKGTHLTRFVDLNQITPTPASQNPYQPGEPIGADDCNTFTTPSGVPVTGQAAINLTVACGGNPDLFRTAFPGIGSVSRFEQKASSIYHSLQASVRRSVGSLLLSASYTYSHSIDDSSSAQDPVILNIFDLARARASSNFDQRHLFTLSYVYDLPFFKSPGLTNKILGGWQWSGITTVESGTPFSVANGIFSDNAGVANSVSSGSTQSYPDVVGDPRANIPRFDFPGFGPLSYNPSAFAAPRGLTFGDTPRNFLTNPTRTNFDMALFKRFVIKEDIAFEFRAEAFNVFNHIEYAWLGGDFGSAASNSPFSNANSTATCYTQIDGPGCITPAGGNPYFRPAVAHNGRILQLGLKFIF